MKKQTLKTIIIFTISLSLTNCSEPTRDANGLLTDNQSTVIRNYIMSQNAKNLKVNLKGQFGSKLRGLKLIGVKLIDEDLSEVDLTSCEILRADFTGANLQKAILTNAIIQESNFANGTIQNVSGYNSDFQGSIFNNITLQDTNFVQANFSNTAFSKTNIKNVNFENARLENVLWNNDTIDGVNFQKAILKNNSFKSNREEFPLLAPSRANVHEDQLYTGVYAPLDSSPDDVEKSHKDVSRGIDISATPTCSYAQKTKGYSYKKNTLDTPTFKKRKTTNTVPTKSPKNLKKKYFIADNVCVDLPENDESAEEDCSSQKNIDSDCDGIPIEEVNTERNKDQSDDKEAPSIKELLDQLKFIIFQWRVEISEKIKHSVWAIWEWIERWIVKYCPGLSTILNMLSGFLFDG